MWAYLEVRRCVGLVEGQLLQDCTSAIRPHQLQQEATNYYWLRQLVGSEIRLFQFLPQLHQDCSVHR